MQNRPQDALPDCHAALEADETYRRALERAASCHRRMGDLKRAEEVLAQAVKASATSPTATADDKAALATRLSEIRDLQQHVRASDAPLCTEKTSVIAFHLAPSHQHHLAPLHTSLRETIRVLCGRFRQYRMFVTCLTG